MESFLQGAAGLVFGFSGLIFVHELGHYILAKWHGVRVNVFSLGMGPYILSYTHGETLYVLSMVPIGGYVKMAGQDDLRPNLEINADPHDYRNKRPGQRAAILAAGAFFNLIFALFLFTICYYVGVDVQPPIIGKVSKDSPLAHAKVLLTTGVEERPLKNGDRITYVNGEAVKSLLEIHLQVAGAGKGADIEINYERNGLAAHEPVVVRTGYDDQRGAAAIGLNPYLKEYAFAIGISAEQRVRIGEAPEEDTPAGKQGLEKGDFLHSLDGKLITEVSEMIKSVKAAEGKEQTLVVIRDGEKMSFNLKAQKVEETYRIGVRLTQGSIVMEIDPQCEAYARGLRRGNFVSVRKLRSGKELALKFLDLTVDDAKSEKIKIPIQSKSSSHLVYHAKLPVLETVKAESMMEALSLAWGDLIRHSTAVFTILKGLILRKVSPKALSGPLGIAQVMTTVAVEHSFIHYIWFLAFLSVNLGVLQIVPIPLLDGWHLVMIAVEKLKGSPVAPKIQEAFQYVGLFIILTLILLATKNDIFRQFM